jgi:uncharacterized protein
MRETREPLPRHVCMPFCAPPVFAAWHHRDARAGFEVTFLHPVGGGYRVEGTTTAVEDGQAWIVGYSLRLDGGWMARSAHVVGRSAGGVREVRLDCDGAGRWRINGTAVAAFDGCVDVDLESSALTNALPVRRLGLDIGRRADAPAVYVRAADLDVERLEQRYLRLEDGERGQRYSYAAPRFEFECELSYDASGLVLAYPGIAVRAG